MGIRFISSVYANSNVDTPALPAEAYAAFEDKSAYAVIDVGGDDRGALALGRYAPYLLADDYEMLFVINKFRFLTASAEDTIEVMKEIEEAAGVKFTAIVNNSNLGEETTKENLLSSIAYANEVSRLTGLPVKMTTVKESVYNELKDEVENLMKIELYVRQSWQKK